MNPRETSKLCSRHHDIFDHRAVEGTMRPTQSQFVCQTCGYSLDADLNACLNIARRFFGMDSVLKVLAGDGKAWWGAIRFLSGRMNPHYFGLGQLGMDADGTPSPVSAPYPYPRQDEVPGTDPESPRL